MSGRKLLIEAAKTLALAAVVLPAGYLLLNFILSDRQAEPMQSRISSPPASFVEDRKPTLDAACRSDLSCSKEYARLSGAEEVCTKAVESLARYDFEWTERWFNRFPGARLLNERRILIGGDAIKFQNGFGAFGRYRYTCEWDLDSKTLIEVKAEII